MVARWSYVSNNITAEVKHVIMLFNAHQMFFLGTCFAVRMLESIQAVDSKEFTFSIFLSVHAMSKERLKLFFIFIRSE